MAKKAKAKAKSKAKPAAPKGPAAPTDAPEVESVIPVTNILEPTGIVEEPRGQIVLSKKVSYLKNVKTGMVAISHPKLELHRDMRPCDKNGNFLSARDAAEDETQMTVQSKVMAISDRKKLIAFLAKYDVTVQQGLKLEEIKAQFLKHVAMGEVAGTTLLSPTEE